MIELLSWLDTFPSSFNSIVFLVVSNPLLMSLITCFIILIIMSVHSQKPPAKAAAYTFFTIFVMNVLNFYCAKYTQTKNTKQEEHKVFQLGNEDDSFIDKYKSIPPIDDLIEEARNI